MAKLWEVLLILAGGAVGGFVSVIDAWQEPIAFPLTFAKIATLFFIPTLKGGLAAGIGVYLLTTVDAAQLIRSFFFAVTCGLTFPSILANSTSYAQRVTSQVATNQVAQNVDKLRTVAAQSTASASAPELPASAVAKIKEASLEIIQAAPKTSSTEAKAADAAVTQAVVGLANSPGANSDSSTIEAIGHIGTAAAAQNLPLTRDVALRELRSIQSAQSSKEPVRERAAMAVKEVERASPASP